MLTAWCLGVFSAYNFGNCLSVWNSFFGFGKWSRQNLFKTSLGSCHASPRCVLLMALVVARGGSFFLEQPSSSLMGEYFRFKWLCSVVKVPQLFRAHNILQRGSDQNPEVDVCCFCATGRNSSKNGSFLYRRISYIIKVNHRPLQTRSSLPYMTSLAGHKGNYTLTRGIINQYWFVWYRHCVQYPVFPHHCRPLALRWHSCASIPGLHLQMAHGTLWGGFPETTTGVVKRSQLCRLGSGGLVTEGVAHAKGD